VGCTYERASERECVVRRRGRRGRRRRRRRRCCK
jgi:hypothetical protein